MKKLLLLCTVLISAISQVFSCCPLRLPRPSTVLQNFIEQGTICPGLPEEGIELIVLNHSTAGGGFTDLINNVPEKRTLTLGVIGLNEGDVNNNRELQYFLSSFCGEAPLQNVMFSRFLLRSKTPATRLVFERFIFQEPTRDLVSSYWMLYNYRGISERISRSAKFCCITFAPCVLTAILSQVPGTPATNSLWTNALWRNSLWANSSWVSFFSLSASASVVVPAIMTCYFCNCEGCCDAIFDDCCCCCIGDPDSSFACTKLLPTDCAYCWFGPTCLERWCYTDSFNFPLF